MHNPESGISPLSENQPEQEEKMVEAVKISTIFPDQRILEQIADSLLSEGVISGFHIDKTLGGYISQGKKVAEDQYSLEILLEGQAGEDIRNRIKHTITKAIGEKWETPTIQEEKVTVNERLFSFIQRAKIEHKKYTTERKKKLVLAFTALLGLAATLTTLGDKYIETREQNITDAERKNAHNKVSGLLQKVQGQIGKIDGMELSGQPLTPSDSEMAVAYEETAEILKTIREVEIEMRKLSKPRNQ